MGATMNRRWRTAASIVAALLALGGLGCAVAALHGLLGSRDIRTQVVQSGGGPLMPMEVSLHPAMNPMRITVTAQVDEKNRAALPNGRENYQLSLYRNGRPQRRWVATLAAEDEERKPRARASFSIEPLEVAEAGQYAILLLRPGGDAAPAFTGHEVRLQRSGARAGDVRLAWQAAILLLLGLLLQAFFGRPLIFGPRMQGMRE